MLFYLPANHPLGQFKNTNRPDTYIANGTKGKKTLHGVVRECTSGG